MTDIIAYVAIDSGMDGMSKPKILYAATSPEELEAMKKRDKALAYRTFDKMIVDLNVKRRQALAKLDGLDRLALGLPSWLEDQR